MRKTLFCNEFGDMPEKCPSCCADLDYTFADPEDEEANAAIQLIKQAAELCIVTMPSEETVEVTRKNGRGKTQKETVSLYEAAKYLLEHEETAAILKGEIKKVKEVRWFAYENYRTDWMKYRGLGIGNLFAEIAQYAEASENTGRISSPHKISDLFDDWEKNSGFDGQIWVCYDEFLGTEYLQYPVMLASLSTDLHDFYLRDLCRLAPYSIATLYVTEQPGLAYAERCLVSHKNPCQPVLVRVNSLTRWAVVSDHQHRGRLPSEIFWRSAIVREENGTEHTVSNTNGLWDIDKKN